MKKLASPANKWTTRFVGDPEVAELNPAYEVKAGIEYPFVPMENVREECEGIGCFGRRVLDAGGYCVFRNGDIIFAKITPCTENGKIAFVEEMPTELGFGSTEFIVLSPRKLVDAKFLYYHLVSPDVRAQCASLMEGTTGRQRVPIGIFRKKITISFPEDLDEQREIVAAIETVARLVEAKQTSIAKLKDLKQSLLQNVLAGKMTLQTALG